MLTFENILELFQEYLLRDPEEEVLPVQTRLCPIDLEQGFPLLRGRHSLPDPGGTVRYTSLGFSGLCHGFAGRGDAGRSQRRTKRP